ncbi:probable protein phosphatase 2C 65 [Olea europaea var. sylvestris]|uniref:probable protein phosphatase 2C 65 n=1 Tax=Olea europaea var. sylvestris TaxID=158386 RepID=UPI000C1D4D5D|nr:probable protein phosphatase 2C 65 [Olea europaea var. sylvestris]
MGQCCSCHIQSYYVENREEEREVEREDIIFRGHAGAHVRLQGSSKFVSMYAQQGKKGTNQDAMTVWENFSGAKDTFFCAVFDGHGPSGHKVARYIRDVLPVKISMLNNKSKANAEGKIGNDHPFLSSWKDKIIKSFQEMDEELEGDASIESYCSGTTSVSILRQGEHLIISNLGDSRAVLCTRDEKDQLISEQLTVDLKPNLPREMERIKSCQGRVLAMDKEPNVYRIWMPDEDCPGLAMARAFGDFCLKDFGLISTPEVTYRKLTQRDEFVVLATDGIWDVLSNDEVVRIVASVKKRSLAAKLLVDQAVRVWRYKYPCAKIDDCAVVCLFFKHPRPLLTKSISEVAEISLNHTELGTNARTDDGLDTVLNCNVEESPENDPNGGVHLDSTTHRPRKRRTVKKIDQVGD